MGRSVRDAVTTILYDLRYSGALLRGNVRTRFRDRGAHNTVNSDYDALRHIFAKIEISPADVLVDVGCGKGRVIAYWLSRALENRIVGIEIDPDIAAATARKFAAHKHVRIVAGDATEVLPPEATVLYLYHPFDGAVMERFKRILDRKNCTIAYYNPCHADLFMRDPHWNVELFDLGEAGRHRYAIISAKNAASR